MAPATPFTVREMQMNLFPKFDNPDPDIRYMSLSDLRQQLQVAPQGFFLQAGNVCNQLIDHLVTLLDDTNGDVQSEALKCIAPVASRCPMQNLAVLVEKLTSVKTSKSQDNSIPATAAKYLIVSFPRPTAGVPPTREVEDVFSAVRQIVIPRLLGYVVVDTGQYKINLTKGMLDLNQNGQVDIDAIDLLNETVRCFGPLFHEKENDALMKQLFSILDHPKAGVVGRKKAIGALAVLSIYLSDSLLSYLVSLIIETMKNSHLQADKRKLYLNLVGSIAHAIPHRFGSYLKTVAPFVLQALSKSEYDDLLADRDEDGVVSQTQEEVKEAGLVALQELLSSCVNDMRPFTEEALDSSMRYIAYDSRLVADSDDEMDDDQEDEFEADEDEDFEEEQALDEDDDDTSWKVRRCAAKSLTALMTTRFTDLADSGVIYEKIAPFLVKRFVEREENVRLEVIEATTMLIQKTRGGDAPAASVAVDDSPTFTAVVVTNTRKRRRGGSDASLFDEPFGLTGTPIQTPSPISGPRAELFKLGPSLIEGAIKLLQQKTVPTKQAATVLLREYAHMRHGGLSGHLKDLIEPVVTTIKSASAHTGISAGVSSAGSVGSAASATGNSLRIESMDLLLAICDTHSSKDIAPYFQLMVPAVAVAINDKYSKMSCKAIELSEGMIMALTPPRSLGADSNSATHIQALFKDLIEKAKANDADLEVRKMALHALGICLMRTANSPLLSADDRKKGLDVIESRMKNETTRLASISAVDALASSTDKGLDLNGDWIQAVSVELANQLRKSDLQLRGASLVALKKLVSNPQTLNLFSETTISQVLELLSPLINVTNLGSLAIAMSILKNFVKKEPQKVLSDDVINSICKVGIAQITGSTLDSFLDLLAVIGHQKVGHPVMEKLLSMSIDGDPIIVGSAVGTLIVSGGQTAGIGTKDLLLELKSEDDKKKALALCVLGEIALRQGPPSGIKPQIFLDSFADPSENVRRTAAISLGRAGAGDVPIYLPVIINAMKNFSTQPLLLHAVNEMLQHVGKTTLENAQLLETVWQHILTLSESEDNKAMSAECLGRLVGFDPKKFIPQLQSYSRDRVTTVRGLVIQALRFALNDSDAALDAALKPVLVPLLMSMLQDSDMENRRLALTTLNSALKHKLPLLLPSLQQLLPLVVKATEIDKSLIREVQMGPFKHKVDDGLETRKGSFETLHTLMTLAYGRLDHHELLERIIAGLADDFDIKILSNLMLTKLITLDPEEMVRRLDAISQKFQATLSVKLKDNAVKQEVEKVQEASKDALRTTVRLHDAFPGASSGTGVNQSPLWRNYYEMVRKDFSIQLAEAESEVKHQS